jgi:hypothetical protein
MKLNTTALSMLASTTIGSVASFAGTTGKAPAPTPPAPATPFVTGTLSLTADTHFMSFGQDVWAAGNNWDDPLFHPSLELNFDLGSGFTGIVGTWWDVNDNAPTSIGSSIQEIDIWAGGAYTAGNWKTTFLYHDWMYASQHERAFELKVAYTNALNPYVLLHYRFDDDISFDTGLVALAGISPGTKLGPVAISFPVQVAFDTDGYHGGDAGFSFASVGVSASIPIIDHVALNLGVTYYYTNDSVIPVNPDNNIITGSAGIAISF